MQRCTVVRGRRAKRMRADDEGRPTGGEVYTRGGGGRGGGLGGAGGRPLHQKCVKFFWKKKLI